jgi:hypothetical protein
MAVHQSLDPAESPNDNAAGEAPPTLKGGRSLVLDVVAALSLALALLIVRGFDAMDRLPVVGVGETMPWSVGTTAESGPVAVDVDVDSDKPEAPEPDEAAIGRSDTSPADTPPPRRSAGIIADFVPFVPDIAAATGPPKTELVESVPQSSGQLAENPPTAVSASPPPRKVEFFLTQTKAHSVGFVVDCSSSMVGNKFEAVRAELARSIAQLKSDQRFFVVFFNDSFFPMTGSSRSPQLVSADRQHKEEILGFLGSAQANGGTNPEPALRFMAGLRPDVIYLLSDGDFAPLAEDTYRQLGAAGVMVHTIGFEVWGGVPILEEIAKRSGGSYRSAGAATAAPSLYFQDPRAVRAALSAADPSVRREAVSVALVRQLPFVKEMIALLGDTDAMVRSTVHEELLKLADGSDFGPRDSEDLAPAVARWTRWWAMRDWKRGSLLALLASGDPDEVWLAASVIRTGRIDAPDELIAIMRGAPSPVWQELRQALRQCCPGVDYGPSDDATVDEVAKAADRWAEWRDAERRRIAEEMHEKRVKQAKEKMRLARVLIEKNPTAVIRRCREIMRDFADTPSAEEARTLLEELGG